MVETILLLSPLNEGSGNKTTIFRIKGHLEKNGYRCICRSPLDFTNSTECAKFTRKIHASLVIGIHVFKTGRLLRDIEIPFVIIPGGTDVNEMSKDAVKCEVMTDVLKKASFVVAFNEALKEDFHRTWPFYDTSRCSIIPQAVSVFPSSFDIRSYIIENHQSLGCDNNTTLFVIAAGIRPVKNPLFLVNAFAEWQKRCSTRFRSFLVIIGPVIDAGYSAKFQVAIKNHPEIVYVPGLPIEDCHAAIGTSFCLVNSSESEGMASAILEAMAQSRPVLVRENQGNCSIVEDRVTGLVYKTPQDFIVRAEELIENKLLYRDLTQNALEYVKKNHSLKSEEDAYLKVINRVNENS